MAQIRVQGLIETSLETKAAPGTNPVKTLSAIVHPDTAVSRMPNVVVLPSRPGRDADERQRRAAAAAGVQPTRQEAPMSGATARSSAEATPRAAAILPLPTRPTSARRWAAGVDDEAEAAPDTADNAAAWSGDAAHHLDPDLGTSEDEASGLAAGTAGTRRARRGVDALAQDADDATLCQWIERIAHQDEAALEALYDTTAARVHGVVLRITQRAALAEEVLEETFWQVWRQAPRFDAARGRPITWLLAMARSRAIDALRREQRFQHDDLPDDDAPEAAADASAHALPPQDLLEATRGHAHVHAALASLEPRARQLVALAFFRGLTHEEIAEQQGMPLGTVKSLIRRALQQLKRVMEAEHA